MRKDEVIRERERERERLRERMRERYTGGDCARDSIKAKFG
jgi:hypothetical protein